MGRKVNNVKKEDDAAAAAAAAVIEYAELMTDLHERCLSLRSLERKLSFATAYKKWKKIPKEERDEVRQRALKGDRQWVLDWLQQTEKLEYKTIRDLRHMASEANITNYSRLSRDQLISLLQDEVDKNV